MRELLRSFDAALEVGDGRTITGRCVPFDIEATVADPWDPVPYREVWRAGAFRSIVKAPHLVHLNFEHDERSILNRLGTVTELIERDDGLHATFRAVGAPGDQALELIAAGALRGLSLGVIMHERGSRTLPDGTVERTRVARLPHVALTGSPAFPGAEITAVRSADPGGDTDPGTPALEAVLDWAAQARARFTPTSR